MRSVSPLNPLNDPLVVYLRAHLTARIDRLRQARAAADHGASAIEWAIITGILAAIAITIGAIIKNKVSSAANSISTGDG
ncbi:MAG TPA: hypothetical protein VF069_08260 [Streptosporangiaceae bacterium]